MDNSILAAEKEVLVAIVKIAQKQRLTGDKGDWKKFLSCHDRKMGGSVSDPAKRSVEDLLEFIKTISDEQVLKFLAKMAQSLSERISLAQLTKSSTEIESPHQRLVRLTLQHPDYLLNYSFVQDEEWVVTELGEISEAADLNSMVAVDCEMVLCQDDTEAVVQVCVVDQNLEVKLNELVSPNKPVADYRTHITGISAKDLEGVNCSLADVQKKMKKLLRKGTILVGHSLSNDLRALKLDHARVIDTSYIFETPHRRRPSLNDLCKNVLGYEVREEGAPHNCLNDARAAMKLVLSKLDSGIDNSIAETDKDSQVPEPDTTKLLLHGIPRTVPREELRRVFPDFTFDLQPRPITGKPKKKYSVNAVFKDHKEAHKAFESLKGKVEKDSFGFPQKLAMFELSTGLPATLYVREMARDQTTSENPTVESSDQIKISNKRSAEAEDQKEEKKRKIELNQCEHHVIEIERLKRELQQRDDEISSLQKIVTALTRKQGL